MPVNTDAGDLTDPPADAGDGDTLPINELFYSLQGEGKLTGTPSVFIRTSGCNLRCWFCDSYHTSWEPTHAWYSIDTIIDHVKEYDQAEHVVLTGGEPLVHEEVVDLLRRLHVAGYHTTVETNGTIYRDAPINLASISPKLTNSTPTAATDPNGSGAWVERHEDRRIEMEALRLLVDAYDFQLKFVVTGADDMPEINDLVARLRAEASASIRDSDILLMPEGATRERVATTQTRTAELAMEHGYRYTPRLHVDLWNDASGT